MLSKTFSLSANLTINRVGYGAAKTVGTMAFGPPKDEKAVVKVLQTAVELGVNHIDTSDYYGPHIANQLISKALHPYPKDLVIVTKVGFKRESDASWVKAQSKSELISAIHDNLRNLKLESLPVVNFRLPPNDTASTADDAALEPLIVLIDLKERGFIQHLGLSNATLEQVKRAQSMTEIVCVQNMYNLVNRKDDPLIDYLRDSEIAYVPFFPLGGSGTFKIFDALAGLAQKLNCTPTQLAQAWLLQRAQNILLIPGTSSLAHLRENIEVAKIDLSQEQMTTIEKAFGQNNFSI